MNETPPQTAIAPSAAPAAAPPAGSRGESLELTILMPCLNEEKTLGSCIGKAQRFLESGGVRGEVLVADNGSSDGSREMARRLGARVVEVALRGYGNALKAGIAAAAGRYVIIGDADDSYDFASLAPFLERLRGGCDLVMGNRFRGGIRPGAMAPLHRYVGNPVLTAIGRLLFATPSRDFHCGLRGLRREAALRMRLRTSGMEFASEMVIKAALLKMKVAEVPTTLSPDGRGRPPHLRTWRDGWRHLRFMLLFSPRWLFLYPGLGLMLAGAAASALLLTGPVRLLGVSFDIDTLVYTGTMVCVGFNAVLFAALTRIYAMRVGLLPEQPALTRLFRYFNLESGLIAGGLVLLLGVAGAVTSLVLWNRHDFGPLTPQVSMRLVVPSAVAILMGVQIIFSSLFFSIMGLEHD